MQVAHFPLMPPPSPLKNDADRIGKPDATRVNLGHQLYDVGYAEGKPVAIWKLTSMPNGVKVTYKARKIWCQGGAIDFTAASILEVARRRRMA